MAVVHTCRDSSDYGYNVVLVTDETSMISEEWQQAALNYAMNNIATKSFQKKYLRICNKLIDKRVNCTLCKIHTKKFT